MGNLSIGGQLSIAQGLPKVSQMGTFTAGSLAALNKVVMIGSKQSISSCIGKIQVGSMAKGKAKYQWQRRTSGRLASVPRSAVTGS